VAHEIPERYVWAVELLDVQPRDLILEIGCGYGHSIPLIAPKLSTGHLTLIDRSNKMAGAAAKRVHDEAAGEKVSILHADLLSNNFPESNFNKIFLFNINVFWMDPVAELAEILRMLKPAGKFYLFHQPPPGHELEEYVRAFRNNFDRSRFYVSEIKWNADPAIASVSIVASPLPVIYE
jgi:ubiquinone/menaquinone biosynthesis C-methylase UbiE